MFSQSIVVSGASAGAGDASAANQSLQITQETAVNTVLGAIADAAVATDANGTVSAKLRGLITLLITQAGYLDGLETVLGATGDASVPTDATGSVSAKLRGLVANMVAMNVALGVPPAPATDNIIDLMMENWIPSTGDREDFTLANSDTVQTLTVPAGTIMASVAFTPEASVAGDATVGWVRYTFDGTTPSATVGHRIRNATLFLNPEHATALKWISEAAATDVWASAEYMERP